MVVRLLLRLRQRLLRQRLLLRLRLRLRLLRHTGSDMLKELHGLRQRRAEHMHPLLRRSGQVDDQEPSLPLHRDSCSQRAVWEPMPPDALLLHGCTRPLGSCILTDANSADVQSPTQIL